MKFNNKLEARKFLKEKKNNNITLSSEEEQALREFFSEDEIKNSVFIEWNFNDCLRNGIDAPSHIPHIIK